MKYNRALLKKYQLRDSIDPISLKDIDEANEWLTGRDPDDAENESAFGEDGITWGQVAEISGVNEQRFNFRSRLPRDGGLGSSSQP